MLQLVRRAKHAVEVPIRGKPRGELRSPDKLKHVPRNERSSRLSLVAEGVHGVGVGGAAGGDVAGEERYGG
jgi:hypothetical protein